MNPLFTSAIVSTIIGLKRTCPKCRRVQVVASNRKRESVRCKFCEADIPSGKFA